MISWQDLAIAPAWFAANLLMFRASWLVAGTWFPSDGVLRRLVHTLVLSWACVVFTSIGLGSVGCLSGGASLAAVAGVAWAIIWLARRSALGQARQSGAFAENSRKTRENERCWLFAWGAWLAFCAGNVVMGGLFEFPSDFDSMMYHVPLVDQWLRAGSLYAPDDGAWFFPGNNELLTLWLVAPFSGDFLLGLTNVLPCLLLEAPWSWRGSSAFEQRRATSPVS